jgi:hypothetical protein
MNLRDLKYLVTVADSHHFGRAAESCFVSQPTLSPYLMPLILQPLKEQYSQIKLVLSEELTDTPGQTRN